MNWNELGTGLVLVGTLLFGALSFFHKGREKVLADFEILGKLPDNHPLRPLISAKIARQLQWLYGYPLLVPAVVAAVSGVFAALSFAIAWTLYSSRLLPMAGIMAGMGTAYVVFTTLAIKWSRIREKDNVARMVSALDVEIATLLGKSPKS